MLYQTKSKKHGFVATYDGDDKYIGYGIDTDSYEVFETELFHSAIQKDSIVFDVGANIGYYSMIAALKMRQEENANGKIFAFEPNAKNFLLLEKNVSSNNLKNIHCVNVALGKIEGETKLYLNAENQGDHRLFDSSDFRMTETCHVTTLDNFAQSKCVLPTIIKIDAQGFDYFILQGAKETIGTTDNLILFTEFWDWGTKKVGGSSQLYFKFLQQNFNDIFIIDEETKKMQRASLPLIMSICSLHGGKNHTNLMCVQKKNPVKKLLSCSLKEKTDSPISLPVNSLEEIVLYLCRHNEIVYPEDYHYPRGGIFGKIIGFFVHKIVSLIKEIILPSLKQQEIFNRKIAQAIKKLSLDIK